MSNQINSPAQSGYGGETSLPARITKQASKQTYYTFRILVERKHLQDAYRSYAYFRWLDDLLDCDHGTKSEKLTLINDQRDLLEACYHKQPHTIQSPEEQMLVDLVAKDHEESSGLQFYLRNMMALMVFDVERCGRWITQAELSEYSRMLSTAVTELLFHFIGHDDPSPRTPDRYQAVRGAHIVHMLRDLLDDIDLGYINLPAEVLDTHQVTLDDLDSDAFRKWVQERVTLARQCFSAGRKYFSTVKSLKCRLAAHAYLARFEWMLMTIERDGYRLRRAYPERKSLRAGGWMAWRVIKSAFNLSVQEEINRPIALPD
ncbi:MAG TPA: squalene/phytoene synthase family protein [Anaerolineales bacterium]|nr:squalene/phytoene synthase family protein [Anaerolineales bacterium]